MDAARWGTFVAASLVLAVTPGPGVFYIVTRTLAQGRAAGLASVAGVALGNLGNAAGASIGLAALLAVSGVAFTAVQWAGAAWLLWLGVQALRRPAMGPGQDQDHEPGHESRHEAGPGALDATAGVTAPDRRRLFRDGLLVALLNPKTTLFFAAFLPPFLDPGGPAVMQGLLLSTAFVMMAAASDSAYVLLAAAVAPAWLARPAWSDRGRWLSAAVYLGLGLWTLTR